MTERGRVEKKILALQDYNQRGKNPNLLLPELPLNHVQ